MNVSSGPKHKYTAPQLLRLLKTQKSDFWIAKGRERTLTLFRLAGRRIPAYRDFIIFQSRSLYPDGYNERA